MKRLILSTVCMLFCATGLWAQTLVDGIYYDLSASAKTASVTSDYVNYAKYSGNITIPSTVTYNGTPYSVTSIGWGAFYGCTELTSITIPNSVTSIEDSAFFDCSGLTSVTIPSRVTSVGNDAFHGCSGLETITAESGNTEYYSEGNCLIEKNSKVLILGCRNSVIPNDVTSIGSSAFSGCRGLASVTIPNSVTSIGWNAFYGCTGLTSVTIPNSVTSIGWNAFYNVKHVIYTGSATGSPWDAISVNGFVDGDFVFSDNTKTQLVAYIGTGGDVSIPNSVTSIESRAFYGCSGLTSITIPNSVTSIGWNAFYGCKGLTSVTIPSSVTSIESQAFYGCSGLTSVTIPNSVTSIGDYAFYDCGNIETASINSQTALSEITFTDKLTSITLGDNITSIKTSAFSGCTGLTSITIPSSVTSIESQAFYGCSGLTSITIPNSVTSIERYAFRGCSGLASVTIPNSVTSIGESAFRGCTGLKEVINKSELNIKKGSTANGYVAYYADYVCNGGKAVIDDFIFSDRDKTLVKYIGDGGDITLPEDFNGEEYIVGANMFDGSTGLTSIIVPCDRYDYFKGAITRYSSIVYGNCTFEVKTNVNNENYGTVTESGIFKKGQTLQITATPSEHYHFVKWNDNNTQNPRTVQVTRDSTFTAVFAIDEHYVFINKNISDAGTVTGDGVYEYNTTVQLTATANEGYRFKGWSDGVMDASREITVTKDIDITANFVALYTLKTIASASQGSASGGGIYEDGEIVTLVANAKPGYVFAQWADGNDENPRYVTVDGNKTYTAIFIEGEQDKYMITWKNWDGRVIKTSEVSYGEVPVFNGEKPTRPDEAGYTFTFNGWSPTIAAASQNAEYTANYIQTATEAEKTSIENEGDISITTTDNTALFTWPENASADTYTLTITRNDEVFCSLTFDGQGRLINLNFPNLRASAEGYQFTVTGLNSGTDYAYDLKAKNGAATVNEYTGEFRTSGDVTTAAPEAEESIVETARYDINGRPLTAPTKGVNIVKYSDGSFEKEFVK